MKGRAILIVEDEYYLAADLAQLVSGEGAEVLGPFADSRAALALLERRRPDCAVLDVNLGGEAGFEVADRLSRMNVPFAFFTGYGREMIPARFAQVTRLEKPADDAKLKAVIKGLCN